MNSEVTHKQSPRFHEGKKVVIGLSGGVDSSVAALLLKQQGYAVSGLFMKNWEEDDTDAYCSAEADLQDAASVARQLDIPVQSRNFSAEYWDNVFQYFLDEYKCGRTPNPDVMCNKEIKFKTFLEHAIDLGADYIATGHYAGIRHDAEGYHLIKAKDRNKDQTYFLYTLGQTQLAHTLFPLADIDKPVVRDLAAEIGFANADKKDSTGICFIGERNFKAFLSRYLPAQQGDIRSSDGQLMGRHDGLMYYTLGQRQGLGIGGQHNSSGDPWYVAGKDLASNTLIVVQGHDNPLLFSQGLSASQLHWVLQKPDQFPFQCSAKTRYRQQDQACNIIRLENDACYVQFDQPQRAVTPGQSIVFYRDDECLGGGIIDRTE